MKYPSENVQNLLDKLSTLSKSPVELSSSSTTSEVSSLPVLSNEEIHAQRLIQYGTVDQVLTFYKNLKTRSTRILNTMGQLYADKKGDYKSAIKHYRQALKIQEKVL
jgi:tetratricopeptide (TPR) repeat protein